MTGLPRRPMSHILPLLLALGVAGCAAYLGSGDRALFLSGRLVDPAGNPLNHCHAGVELDGLVDDWRPIASDLREMFLLSRLAEQYRIIIQCSGYEERRVTATAMTDGGWEVDGIRVGVNETVQLGEVVLEPI